MNERAVIGGNHPPEPIDPMEAIQAQYDDTFAEVANWLDGSPVENEAQMKAVDALLASVKDAEKDAKAAKEDEYRPHKAAGDAVIARWKPFLDDLDRQKKGLTAASDAFKRKLAAEKAEADRKARAEAEAKMRAAREAEERANAADLEAQRAAAQAKAEADAAVAAARAASKDTVPGLRTFDVTEVLDRRALINWIATNRKDDLAEWMDDYARRNKLHIPGVVETRQERRAV